MHSKYKIFLSLLNFILIFSFFTVPVRAQVPNPPVGCSEIDSPEFHSLRPYQKSPCNSQTSDLASFCGNNLTLKETVEKTYVPGDPNCELVDDKIKCTYKISVNKTITIDLSNASLPIMGNTELVTNYEGKADQLTDAQKVNEYVSWYLNGVTNKAEYTFLDSEKKEDLDKIINFSGPLKKLLPEKIQREARVDTIKSAKETRHDQIVGCVYNLRGLFKVGQIVECYPKTPEKSYVRLSDWQKNNHMPPNEEDYKKFSDYWTDYKRWRGKSCITILGFNLCIDNPLKPNYWGNLFQNIPFSSTEDRKGRVMIDNISSATQDSSKIKVTKVNFSNQTPAELFFSHMQETDELGEILQGTYAQKGADLTGAPTGIDPAKCDVVDVRSNSGDDLFAGQISGKLSYDASFTCEFNPQPCKICSSSLCIPTNIPNCSPSQNECESNANCRAPIPNLATDQTCKKDIYISLSTKSDTPNIENIWSRLVAGPSSVFKRIFPKLGTYIGSIKDIPGSTAISYSGPGIDENTDLKLPHIGGISEYFLKGIQTMLRPKGYGEPISFGEESTGTCGAMPNLPTANGACKLASTSIGNITLPPTMINIVEAASQSYNVPPGLILGIMYGEGAFNAGGYDWTEDNVKKWSLGCASMPNCSPGSFPSTGVVPFFEDYWNNLKDAVKVVDPNRKTNPCNLLDATFALAKDLNQSQNGSGAFSGKTCYGITLNAGGGGSASCSWDKYDYETAIRVWEFGTAYNNTFTCATKAGSCAVGGIAAACPGGDFCEKVGGSGNTSHNACIWNVAHSH